MRPHSVNTKTLYLALL